MFKLWADNVFKIKSFSVVRNAQQYITLAYMSKPRKVLMNKQENSLSNIKLQESVEICLQTNSTFWALPPFSI